MAVAVLACLIARDYMPNMNVNEGTSEADDTNDRPMCAIASMIGSLCVAWCVARVELVTGA